MKMLNNIQHTQRASFTRRLFFCALPCLLLCLVATACKPGKPSAKTERTAADSVMNLRYAQGFQVAYFPQYKKVSVKSPWTSGQQVYYLYHGEKPADLPQDGPAIRIPLQKVALTSCTHVGFMDRLGLLTRVGACCNLPMVYQSEIRQAAADGRVADLGDNFAINAEKTISLGLDAMFWSGYGQVDTKVKFLQQAGLPVVENNEWMEKELLGRAEWLRFMAVFFDEEVMADSLFLASVEAYTNLKQLAAADSLVPKKTILAGENFRGTWYVPGGGSYMAQLFRDAGASYYFENDSTKGSHALSLERVLRDMGHSDIWVGVDASTLKQLEAKDARYSWFDAFRNKQVYAYNRRSTSQGGNDFWESGVARPEWLLADFVKLLHPQLLPEQDWNFLVALP